MERTVETISHDTEVFLKGVKTINTAPTLVASETETSTTDPELEAVPVAQAPEPAVEQIAEPVGAAIPAGALAGLKMKTVEANVLESVAMSRSPSSQSTALESFKISEPVAKAPSVTPPPIPTLPISTPPPVPKDQNISASAAPPISSPGLSNPFPRNPRQ